MITSSDLTTAHDRASAARYVAATIRLNIAFAAKEGMGDVAVVLGSALRLAEREQGRAEAVIVLAAAEKRRRPALAVVS